MNKKLAISWGIIAVVMLATGVFGYFYHKVSTQAGSDDIYVPITNDKEYKVCKASVPGMGSISYKFGIENNQISRITITTSANLEGTTLYSYASSLAKELNQLDGYRVVLSGIDTDFLMILTAEKVKEEELINYSRQFNALNILLENNHDYNSYKNNLINKYPNISFICD